MRINVEAMQMALCNSGLTASQLAVAAGVSKGTALRYVKRGGNGSAPTFYKLAKVLGVKPSSLVLPMD